MKRVSVEADTDVLRVLDDVHLDKEPRLIERNGEALVVVVALEDDGGASAEPRSKRLKDSLLSFAGIWSDLDAERMIAEVLRARGEAPPSPPTER